MSAQKNKTPLIAIIAAVLLVIAGTVALLVNKSSNNGGADKMAAAAMDNQEMTTPEEKEAANVAAAAGNASDDAKQEAADNTPEQQPQLNVAEGIQVEPGNPVVAKVDGKDIVRTDVYRFIQTMPQNIQQLPALTVYPIAMEQVVNTRIVQTKADQANIEDTEAFKRELDIAKQQIERNLFIQQQVDAKISEGMIKDEYNAFLKKAPDVEERHARHILLDSEDKAKAVIEKLNKGGDFEALAKELSKDPMGKNGGDLGYFAKNEMVPEFSNTVFAMKKGEVSQTPIKTQFGYHVAELLDVRDRAKPTLEQMTPIIKAELSRKVLDELIQKWRKEAKIEQFDINGKPLKEGANAIGIIPQKPEANSKQDG